MKELFKTFIQNFGMLTQDEVELLVDRTEVRSFKKGVLIQKQGCPAKNCFLVLKGCVREYFIKDGLGKSTAYFMEGDSIASYINPDKNNATYERNWQYVEDCI